MVTSEKFGDSETEILFLTRELRFAVSLIHSAMEETEKFDLVINDPSFLNFMLLSSQGVERLLKLVLSYDSIIKDKKEKFIPKIFGHSISKLYNHFKANTTKNIKKEYIEMFENPTPTANLLNMFTDLLEKFNGSGRYYFTSKDTRENERFGYYFDERFVYIINEYERIKIFNKYHKISKYNKALKYAIEEAKMISEEYDELVPKIFCRNIYREPVVPFWQENSLGFKESATSSFKMVSREFLLLYISPVISMLENQFIMIMDKYNIPYHFSELTETIRNKSYNYRLKKHKKILRDVYSSLLL